MSEQDNERDVEGGLLKDARNDASDDTEGHRIRHGGHGLSNDNENEDVEGHRMRHGGHGLEADEDEDVEGHRMRHGGHGLEADDEDEDVEGHRHRHSNTIQPDGEADLGNTER
jgi:hypothetical protein